MHRPFASWDRRQFLHGVACGVAVVAAGGRPELGRLAGAGRSWADDPPKPAFEHAALPYGFDALEPIIDAQTMQIHHGKHHKAYVDGLNKLMAATPELAGKTLPQILADKAALVPEANRQVAVNMGGGHANHALFWTVLGPKDKVAGGATCEGFDAAVKAAFTDLTGLKNAMTEQGMKRFGSGWSWLVKDGEGKLSVYSTANQDSPLMTAGHTPIFGIDVWEHAYYLKYQNRRAEYLKAIWDVVDWTAVDKRWIG